MDQACFILVFIADNFENLQTWVEATERWVIVSKCFYFQGILMYVGSWKYYLCELATKV